MDAEQAHKLLSEHVIHGLMEVDSANLGDGATGGHTNHVSPTHVADQFFQQANDPEDGSKRKNGAVSKTPT